MKIIPTGDRLLVKLNKVEERMVGHIYVQDNHEERSRIGTVLAIGERVTQYVVGSKVLVPFYHGIVIHLLEEGFLDDTLRIFAEREIMAKIED